MSHYEHQQQAVIFAHLSRVAINETVTFAGCGPFWDPVQARFGTCHLYFIRAFPAVIAACIVLGWALRLLLPYRPGWSRPFVEEFEKHPKAFVLEHKKSRQLFLFLLFLFSICGLAFSAVAIWHPAFQLEAVYPALAWVLSLLLVAVARPRTASGPLLLVYTIILASRAIVLVDGPIETRSELAVAGLEILMSAGAIVVILSMPFRDPRLPKDDIAPTSGHPTFELRSPEDDLTLWQFLSVTWMVPLISVGKTRQLHDEDVWQLNYEFQHRKLHDKFREIRGSVVGRLLEANGLDLLILGLVAIIDTLASLSIPILLQQLLRSMEDVYAPRRAAIVYAVLSLFARLISTQTSVISLWYGRRCYERSRGEMITMLYEKTLSRKIIGESQKPTADDTPVGEDDADQNSKTASKSRLRSCWHGFLIMFRFRRDTNVAAAAEQIKEPASMGKILNLMRNDVYEVAQRFWEFQSLIQNPLGLVISIILIWDLIGWPCLLGIVTVLIGQAINVFVIRALLRQERKRRVTTDIKLKQVSQFVEAIRHLRWYGWENAWLKRIMEARQNELKIRVITTTLGMLMGITNMLASGLFPVVAFYAYSALAGRPLRIDVTFPALQLFGTLDSKLREIPSLITVMLNARVAVGRIEDFMREPDKGDLGEKTNSERRTSEQENGFAEEQPLVDGLVKPNGLVHNDREDDTDGIRHPVQTLTNSPLHLELRQASFNWPSGPPVLHNITLSFPVGLTVISGEVGAGKSALLQALLGELDRQSGELIKPNGMIAYCAQTPWLQSMNIRENIMFSEPYDDKRYKEVLEACALTPDLATFKHGDLSNIGENGIGLSGGQKARVALARAVYSQAKILLLDDPISALDHQTAEFIVQKCFKGDLMRDRVVILVTHRLELCQHVAEQIIEIAQGKARVLDQDQSLSNVIHPTNSTDSTGAAEANEDKTQAAVPDKFIEDEYRAEGGVQLRVYWEYIKSGGLKWWFILVCLLAIFRLITVGETWFLKQLGEAYDESETSISIKSLFDSLPSPETNIRPWLVGLALIAIAKAMSYLVAQSFMLVIVYKAGQHMFRAVMEKVSHATFRFYDVTPVGRLMNRLTSDINTIDGNISAQFQNVAFVTIAWVTSLVVIASVTPTFLVFSFLLTSGFVYTFLRFLPSSQSLRRLEMVSLSPLMSNFGALLEGLMTVRAFCAEYRFQDRVIHVVDAFQKMDHFYWSLQSWLMYRFNLMSDFSTLILTLLAIYTGVSPGLTAFVLIAANQFVQSTHSLCRSYGRLQMDFVSVERIVELLYLDQEPGGSVQPPAWWPTLTGDIIFDNVTVRYAPNLDPALSDLSFRIKAGSNTAIVGRTGSGKSTIAMALLATVLPEAGRIEIDNFDVSEVDKLALRHRVTFVAQDPVLFPGTMRENLDPLEEYSDENCDAVLQKVCGKHQWTLKTQVDAGGKNLSQGQRQLIGLARTVLRRSPIVILDEATASIDMDTAMSIQQILHEEMRESTVITIAHRLEAVKYAEYCIVLGKGRVIKQGPASEILKESTSSTAGDK